MHTSLPALLAEIEKAAATFTNEDKSLIDALRTHYLESEIYKVAGVKLLESTTP